MVGEEECKRGECTRGLRPSIQVGEGPSRKAGEGRGGGAGGGRSKRPEERAGGTEDPRMGGAGEQECRPEECRQESHNPWCCWAPRIPCCCLEFRRQAGSRQGTTGEGQQGEVNVQIM